LFTNSGRHIQISGRRYCQTCQTITAQVCHKVGYRESPEQAGSLLKESFWICSLCVTESEELEIQSIPGDKVKIIGRLLRMQDDYAIRSMKIASRGERLIVEISVDESADRHV
jgi:hypothetical protein